MNDDDRGEVYTAHVTVQCTGDFTMYRCFRLILMQGFMYFFHVIPAKIVSNTKIFWHNNTSVLTDFFSWPSADWIILT